MMLFLHVPWPVAHLGPGEPGVSQPSVRSRPERESRTRWLSRLRPVRTQHSISSAHVCCVPRTRGLCPLEGPPWTLCWGCLLGSQCLRVQLPCDQRPDTWW